jgi:hypothetical protein
MSVKGSIMYNSKSEKRRVEIQARQRVNIERGLNMRSVYAITAYQIASLAVTCAVVFGIGTSPWWLLLHLVSCLWYIVITKVFME